MERVQAIVKLDASLLQKICNFYDVNKPLIEPLKDTASKKSSQQQQKQSKTPTKSPRKKATPPSSAKSKTPSSVEPTQLVLSDNENDDAQGEMVTPVAKKRKA